MKVENVFIALTKEGREVLLYKLKNDDSFYVDHIAQLDLADASKQNIKK